MELENNHWKDIITLNALCSQGNRGNTNEVSVFFVFKCDIWLNVELVKEHKNKTNSKHRIAIDARILFAPCVYSVLLPTNINIAVRF